MLMTHRLQEGNMLDQVWNLTKKIHSFASFSKNNYLNIKRRRHRSNRTHQQAILIYITIPKKWEDKLIVKIPRSTFYIYFWD